MVMSMLTTIDNPFDPFDEFDEWNAFDVDQGYNTTDLLARIVKTSEELSEADYNLAIENAIDEIVKYNASGKHRKVTRED